MSPAGCPISRASFAREVGILTSRRSESAAYGTSLSFEYPRLTHQKIYQRAQRNRDPIGHEIVHPSLPDHHLHQREIPDNRNRTVREIEAQKTRQRTRP